MNSLIEQVRRRPPSFTPEVARAIRLKSGVSQVRLAQEVGVHPVTVTRWEHGTRTPSGVVGEQYRCLLRDLQEVL